MPVSGMMCGNRFPHLLIRLIFDYLNCIGTTRAVHMTAMYRTLFELNLNA